MTTLKLIQENYFAAADTKDIAGVLSERTEDWVRFHEGSINFQRMRKSHQMYFGLTKYGNAASSEIKEAGPDGEYSLMTVNHYRNLLKHLHVLTTAQKTTGQCKAINTDFDSKGQTILGNQIIEYYNRVKKVNRSIRSAAEKAIVLSEGYVASEWNPTAGRAYATNPKTGMPVYEGDFEFEDFGPLSIIRDWSMQGPKLPWCTIIRWKNKYNLAAKFPELADQIIGIQPENDKIFGFRNNFLTRALHKQDELIPEFTFFHEKCEAIPTGRMTKYLTRDIKTADGGLPYKNVPVFRMSPGEQFDTPFGYTVGYDLLGPQDAMNLLHSIILTNQKTFGVGSIVAPQGHNIEYSQLADGLSLITANEKNGQIRPLNLTSTPAEIFNYKDSLKGDMELLSAVNSVMRGQPEQNIESGAYAALLTAQSIQFNSDLQESYSNLAEDVYTGIIEGLQLYANTDRIVEIAGKNKQYMQKSFTKKDIDKLVRVYVDVQNPLQETIGGRMQLAEQLQAGGHIKNADQFIQVYTTGRLDPILEDEQTSQMLMTLENEKLRVGENPLVLKTHAHVEHIKAHHALLDDPDVISQGDQSPQVTSTLAHIQTHIDMLATVDPRLLQILGQPSLMPPGGPMPPPNGAPAPGGPGPGPASDSMKTAEQNIQGAGPSMPNMPTNPMTGEQVNPMAGAAGM